MDVFLTKELRMQGIASVEQADRMQEFWGSNGATIYGGDNETEQG